jgi:CRISPR system Cascade subunit CasB
MNSTDQKPTKVNVAREQGSLKKAVTRISQAIDRELSSGDVAELRRLRANDPSCSAFWRVTALFLDSESILPEGGPARDRAENRWATILQAMATLRGLHQPHASFGRSLAEADLTELRFIRLLRARGERLADAVRTATHLLASKGVPTNPVDISYLVLSDGRGDEEKVRRRIARGFYSRFDRSEKGES